MNNQKWTVTRDLFLSAEQVQGLYTMMTDALDLAVLRKKNLVHVRDYFILKTLLETGVRVAELTALKIGDIQSGSLIVQRGKGGKKRNIILGRSTQRMLKDFLKAKKATLGESTDAEAPLFMSERKGPYTTRAIRKRVKFWFQRYGLADNLSCHSCRHTYVSHLIAAGVDLPTVRDNAGHSSLSTTSIYSHATKDELGVNLYE